MKISNKVVYRIFKLSEFNMFKKYKFFDGNRLDKVSGFIHLSTKNQIEGTIQKYFIHEKNIMIAEFLITDLEKFISWEESRDKEVFPHYYGKLEFKWVRKYYEKLFNEL